MAEHVTRSMWTSWLENQWGTGHHAWAVVDAAAVLASTTRQLLDRCSPCVNLLTHRTTDEDALAVAPRLIQLGPSHCPVVIERLWLNQPADEPAMFFVSTSLDAQALEASLRRCVRAALPDGDVMLFRWWDARIWWALQQLTEHQHPDVKPLLGHFTSSLFLARDGEACVVAHTPLCFNPEAESIDLKLNQPTCDRLLDLGEADAVLGICRGEYPGALEAVLPERRHALACGQIDWAMDAGFSAPHDHALALRIAAELGHDWHQQPEWLGVVDRARSQGQTLLAAIGAM